jgi:hypothetical protein
MTERSVYLWHRLGFAIILGELALVSTYFLENRTILETATGTAGFFWLWSIILLPLPLIAGSPRSSALRFFSLFVPLFVLYGLIALVTPDRLFVRTISILTIIWGAALTFLMKRKPQTLNLEVNLKTPVFLESLVLLLLSALASFAILTVLRATNALPTLFSAFAGYVILMAVLFAVLSAGAISIRYFTTSKE